MTTNDRRTQIADAVVATLATEGSRGLTHRAVDRAAGLPPGSTSYYLRTRADLVQAAVTRLAELDAAAVRWTKPGEPVAASLARVLHGLLTSERTQLLARYELALESVRRPELRDLLARGTSRVREGVATRLEEDGVADPHRAAADVMALLEGLLFTEVTGGGRARTRTELRAAIERVL